MSETSEITNHQRGITLRTMGGSCKSSNVIYAAECTKHKNIYTGYTTNHLHKRFDQHRHDANHKPEATDLSNHFHYSTDCNFRDNLRVYVLERCAVKSEEYLANREDLWIGKLGTRYPGGMNSRTGEVYTMYTKIFD